VTASYECPKLLKASLRVVTYLLDNTSTFTFIPLVLWLQKWLIIDLKKWYDPIRILLSTGREALEKQSRIG